MSWNVCDKVAVVTGASCTLGKAIVERLATRHQMRVACVSRKVFAEPLPLSCTAFQADMTRGDDCDALMKVVCEKMGPLSLLINCAGVTLSKVHLRCTEEDYMTVMDTNLKGALQVTRAALRYGGLLKHQDGAVLHIGSVAGVVGSEGQVLYSASKAALGGAAKSWALEYGARNIRFNVVAPGLIEGTGMAATLSVSQQQQWRDACPLKRLATVAEVADLAVAIALCPYMNGQTVAVDGGRS